MYKAANRKKRILCALALIVACLWPVADRFADPSQATPAPTSIAVEWVSGRPQGQVQVIHGTVTQMKLTRGRGRVEGQRFSAEQDGPFRLEIQINGSAAILGKGSTLVMIQTRKHPFSFFLRDVDSRFPIFIPAYQVTVTQSSDPRSYEQIQADLLGRGLQASLRRNTFQGIITERSASTELFLFRDSYFASHTNARRDSQTAAPRSCLPLIDSIDLESYDVWMCLSGALIRWFACIWVTEGPRC